jgi:hypothetical protein
VWALDKGVIPTSMWPQPTPLTLLQTPPAGYSGALGDFSAQHAEYARVAEYNHLLEGLEGYGPSWNPWAPATRGEAAQMLAQLIELKSAQH